MENEYLDAIDKDELSEIREAYDQTRKQRLTLFECAKRIQNKHEVDKCPVSDEYIEELLSVTTQFEDEGDEDRFFIWMSNPSCPFRDFLCEVDYGGIGFDSPTVNACHKAATKVVLCVSFKLIKKDDYIIARVITSENLCINTSPILAVHTSSGTMTLDGFRYVNFLTASGSIYCGSGKDLDDKDMLFNKLIYFSTL
jgi:hypothetical protein